MKFTFEAKDLNSFSFLDVRITLSLLLQLFSKPHLVEFLRIFYDSFIFDVYKEALVHALLLPHFKICFSVENFQTET